MHQLDPLVLWTLLSLAYGPALDHPPAQKRYPAPPWVSPPYAYVGFADRVAFHDQITLTRERGGPPLGRRVRDGN